MEISITIYNLIKLTCYVNLLVHSEWRWLHKYSTCNKPIMSHTTTRSVPVSKYSIVRSQLFTLLYNQHICCRRSDKTLYQILFGKQTADSLTAMLGNKLWCTEAWLEPH